MASVRKRTNRNGSATYAVLFRHHGKQTSLTFADEKSATDFKTLVEILGPDRALAEAEAGQADAPTLDELAEKFFKWKRPRVRSDRTVNDYERDYKNWIKDTLGHRRAASVDEVDVQQLVDSWTDAGLSPKSVADRHMVLHSIYKWATAKTRRLVEHNPCLETEMPKRRKRQPKHATPQEWGAIYEAAQRLNPDAADLLFFIVATGWRWSEATGLTVAAIEEYEDEYGRQHMLAVMGRVFRRNAAHQMVLVEDAKSDAGQRRVKLGPTAAALVRRRMIGKGGGDLIFTNASGRKWYQTNFLNRTWPKILEAADVTRPITPHWLRHTHVYLLNRTKKVSLPEIQRRIGHESITTTIDVYGKGIDDISDDALEALDELLTGRAVPIEGTVVRGELA